MKFQAEQERTPAKSEPMPASTPTERSGPGFGGLLRTFMARMPWGETLTEEEVVVVPAPSGRALTVRNANGKTRVYGENREDIEIRVTKSVGADCPDKAAKLLDSIHLQNAEAGEILDVEVQIPRRCSRHGLADLELRVPRDTEVSLSSNNGKISLQGLERSIQARSSNGSVSICEVSGDIDVTTANAKVTCRSTQGHLRAHSSNGKIEVGGHHGSIDASTSNGVIKASLDELGETGVSLKTSNGRITLELPEAPDADVDIHVENGHIRNDLDLDLEHTASDSADRVRGRIGKGGTPIRLRTSNGTISLR